MAGGGVCFIADKVPGITALMQLWHAREIERQGRGTRSRSLFPGDRGKAPGLLYTGSATGLAWGTQQGQSRRKPVWLQLTYLISESFWTYWVRTVWCQCWTFTGMYACIYIYFHAFLIWMQNTCNLTVLCCIFTNWSCMEQRMLFSLISLRFTITCSFNSSFQVYQGVLYLKW